MPSGPYGKEKLAMGSIPGLYKNVLLGLIPKNEIDLSWDCLYERLCREVPMVKKEAMGSIPSLYKNVLLGLIPNVK